MKRYFMFMLSTEDWDTLEMQSNITFMITYILIFVCIHHAFKS